RASTHERASDSRIATAPRATADIPAKAPRNFPIGVRAPETMTDGAKPMPSVGYGGLSTRGPRIPGRPPRGPRAAVRALDHPFGVGPLRSRRPGTTGRGARVRPRLDLGPPPRGEPLVRDGDAEAVHRGPTHQRP